MNHLRFEQEQGNPIYAPSIRFDIATRSTAARQSVGATRCGLDDNKRFANPLWPIRSLAPPTSSCPFAVHSRPSAVYRSPPLLHSITLRSFLDTSITASSNSPRNRSSAFRGNEK